MPKVPGREESYLPVCKNPKCGNLQARGMKGLCMKCYSAAKKLVEKGETSWGELAGMGMCEMPVEPTDFASVFRAKKQQQDQDS